MVVATRRNLRRMCNHKNLFFRAKALKSFTHRIRRRTANTGVHLIKDQRFRGSNANQRNFERQHEPG